MIITEPESLLFNTISPKIDLQWRDGMRHIGKVTNRNIVGVLTFELYTGHSIWIHMWLRHKLMYPDLACAGYDYVFNQLGCKNLFAQVKSDRTAAISVFNRMGFLPHTVIPEVYSDTVGSVVLRATKDSLSRGKYGNFFINTEKTSIH